MHKFKTNNKTNKNNNVVMNKIAKLYQIKNKNQKNNFLLTGKLVNKPISLKMKRMKTINKYIRKIIKQTIKSYQFKKKSYKSRQQL